jgi:photosystem II stability/assembly factor-like uncharacterized protein
MRNTLSAITLCMAVVAALTACGTRHVTHHPGTAPQRGSASAHGLVRAAQLVRGRTGWALSGNALSLTRDGGQTWTAITPPGVPATTIRGAYFLNTQRGWVVSDPARNPDQLEISATTDGGRSWSTAPLGSPSVYAAGSAAVPAYIDFADPHHGWVVSMIASGSGVLPRGVLLRTINDGASWQTLPMPVGGPVEFVTPATGWLADGYQGEQPPRFYVTTDGGRHWAPEAVSPPAGFNRNQAVYSIPAFTRAANVIMAAYDNGTRSTAGFYQTSDRGAHWQLAATVPTGNAAGDASPLAAVIDPAHWISVAVNGNNITHVTQDGAHQVSVSPSGLPTGGVGFPSFTSTTGWVMTDSIRCIGFKCDRKYTETIGLYETTDGGHHWRVRISAQLGP